MNKLLLGLGVVPLTILPVVAIASCSTVTPTTELSISLLSERTTVTQATINKTIDDIKVTQVLPETTQEEVNTKNKKLIENLSNVALGVSIDNIDDFEISFFEIGEAKMITLTGKLIGNRQNIFPKSLDENKKTLTIKASPTPTKALPISLRVDITQAKIDQAIKAYTEAITLVEMVAALNIVFETVTVEHLTTTAGVNPLLVEINVIVPGIITLIAAPDYYFTNVNTTILIAKPAPIIPPVSK